jgi:hypothetical protein
MTGKWRWEVVLMVRKFLYRMKKGLRPNLPLRNQDKKGSQNRQMHKWACSLRLVRSMTRNLLRRVEAIDTP